MTRKSYLKYILIVSAILFAGFYMGAEWKEARHKREFDKDLSINQTVISAETKATKMTDLWEKEMKDNLDTSIMRIDMISNVSNEISDLIGVLDSKSNNEVKRELEIIRLNLLKAMSSE